MKDVHQTGLAMVQNQRLLLSLLLRSNNIQDIVTCNAMLVPASGMPMTALTPLGPRLLQTLNTGTKVSTFIVFDLCVLLTYKVETGSTGANNMGTFGNMAQYCARGCPSSWIGDKVLVFVLCFLVVLFLKQMEPSIAIGRAKCPSVQWMLVIVVWTC
jgi:hypothetical protein